MQRRGGIESVTVELSPVIPAEAGIQSPSLLDPGFRRGDYKIPLARRRAPERLPKRGFALFEAKPSLQSPGSIEEHRESRQRRDKCPGGPFFGSFLWASKEMNEAYFPAPRTASRANWLMSPQSPRATASDGATQEPPTHATFPKAR